jgi:hypothetical protein
MTKKLLTTMLALAFPALAQTTIKDALVKHWKVTSDFTIAVAKQMPADSYGFRPVPAELSFGQLMVQIGGANLNACGLASGMTGPAVPEKLSQALKDEKIDIDKDAAVQFLADTFKFCNDARTTAARRRSTCALRASRRPRIRFSGFSHWFEQYGWMRLMR